MLNYLYASVLIILVILGISQLLGLVSAWILTPRNAQKALTLIPVKGHVEDVELLIRSAVLRASWCSNRSMNVIALDCGTDAETADICRKLAEESPLIKFCSSEELEDYINLILVNPVADKLPNKGVLGN
ncbi:MAG: hypothetical protein LBS74_10440 [Oscillospiraceae bacterium]|nr:hypothetical protein [Oscillospiraceae bacterium]